MNINSLHSKIHDFDLGLKLQLYDIVFLNETKFDKFKPISFYKNRNYNILRRDRDFDDEFSGNKGGGIIIFNKKQYKYQFIISPEIDMICLNISIGNKVVNFISASKSPSKNKFKFLLSLESFMLTQDLSQTLLIVGDLNMDLLKNINNEFVSEKGVYFKNS